MVIPKIVALTLIAICWHKSNAQQITPDMDKLNKLLNQDKSSQFSKSFKPDTTKTPIVIPPQFADNSQPVYENDLGKVYTLPLDNMPMLKPNLDGQIPSHVSEKPLNEIPNPLYRQKAPFVIQRR